MFKKNCPRQKQNKTKQNKKIMLVPVLQTVPGVYVSKIAGNDAGASTADCAWSLCLQDC